MQTHRYFPPAPLSYFIEVIWFSQASSFDYANFTLPMPNHELIINFSDHFSLSDNHQLLITDQMAWLSGLQTRPVRTTTGGKHCTVGILFKPWGLYALKGIDAFEHHNQHVPLAYIFGKLEKQL